MTAAGTLIDTYVWMEISRDSLWGQRALAWMEENPGHSVSVLTLYELRYRFNALYGAERTDAFIATVLNNSEVIPVDRDIALLAGEIKTGQKRKGSNMGAVDCMILATARVYGLKILSGDKHFHGLEEILDLTAT